MILSFEKGYLKPETEIIISSPIYNKYNKENIIMIGDNERIDIGLAKNLGIKSRKIEKWW